MEIRFHFSPYWGKKWKLKIQENIFHTFPKKFLPLFCLLKHPNLALLRSGPPHGKLWLQPFWKTLHSFTMEGVPDPPELRGIIPNAFQQIFDKVGLASDSPAYFRIGSQDDSKVEFGRRNVPRFRRSSRDGKKK